MLFQAVLAAVIVYLAACYAYGLVLLWKLYADRRQLTMGGTIVHGVEDSAHHVPAPRTAATSPAPAAPRPAAGRPAYHVPAKAA